MVPNLLIHSLNGNVKRRQHPRMNLCPEKIQLRTVGRILNRSLKIISSNPSLHGIVHLQLMKREEKGKLRDFRIQVFLETEFLLVVLITLFGKAIFVSTLSSLGMSETYK